MRRFQVPIEPRSVAPSGRQMGIPSGLLLAAAFGCRPDTGRCLPGDDPGPARAVPAGTPPNVLVVVLDDVGTDQVRAYGEHPAAPPTPTLDALAARGLRFRNAYAHPSCSPTRAALLTGRHAIRTGAGANYTVSGDRALSPDEVTLAEVLGGAGYTTAAVGKWHLAGLLSADALLHPLVQGFDTHRGTAGNLTDAVDGGVGLGYTRWERVVDGQVALTRCYATTAAVDDALDIVAHSPEPWFVWLGLHAAHSPWHVPPRHLLSDPVRDDDPVPVRYNAAVTAADHELGRLLDGLGPERLARTLVVAVGDNGAPPDAALWPRLRHQVKLSLYEGGIHVPWIVAGPGVVPGVSDALVQAEDLLPTVAELAGAPIDALALDGISVASVLADPAAPGPTLLLPYFDATTALHAAGGGLVAYAVAVDDGPAIVVADPRRGTARATRIACR